MCAQAGSSEGRIFGHILGRVLILLAQPNHGLCGLLRLHKENPMTTSHLIVFLEFGNHARASRCRIDVMRPIMLFAVFLYETCIRVKKVELSGYHNGN